jgi:hypothetical protein
MPSVLRRARGLRGTPHVNRVPATYERRKGLSRHIRTTARRAAITIYMLRGRCSGTGCMVTRSKEAEACKHVSHGFNTLHFSVPEMLQHRAVM